MMPFPPSHRWRILHFSWIAFCFTFFAWFAFAPLAPLIQGELALSDSQLGWLATAGVVLTIPGRILIGRMVDVLGPRRTYSLLLAGLSLPVAMLAFADTFFEFLVLRLIIGLVGCGFVIGIRLVGDWFPRRQLGLAEGIYAGCGNAGSALAALLLPVIALSLGWRTAALIAAFPMLVWSVAFWNGVSDVPAGSVFRRTPRESTFNVWGDRRVMILALAYLACFGSELCVVSFLPKYFYDKFEISLVSAGLFAAIFGGSNIIARPGGGWLADRFGHKRVLITLLGGMMFAYVFLGLAGSFPVAVAAVLFTSFFVQSSEGAVFAIVPAVSPTHTGRIAGIVGAAGNVGGMMFPLVFGYGLEWTGGSYLPGFLVLSVAGAVAALAVTKLTLPEGHAGHTHGFEFRESTLLPVRVPMRSLHEQVMQGTPR